MREIDEFLYLAEAARGTGRTTLLAKAVLEVEGYLVAANERHAEQLRRQFPGLDAVTLDQLRPLPVTTIWDHFAVEQLLYKASVELQAMRKEIHGFLDEKGRLLERQEMWESMCAYLVQELSGLRFAVELEALWRLP